MTFTLRRQVARAIVFEPEGRALLLQGADPSAPDAGSWWELPGGGIDGRESSEDAARRELHEEAGILDVEIGPCVWVHHAVFRFAGIQFDQWEQIHVAWTDRPTDAWEPAALESLEAMALSGQRWWEVDALLDSTDRTLPVRLREVLPDLADGALPTTPIDITHP